jgi:hypothetical protein
MDGMKLSPRSVTALSYVLQQLNLVLSAMLSLTVCDGSHGLLRLSLTVCDGSLARLLSGSVTDLSYTLLHTL